MGNTLQKPQEIEQQQQQEATNFTCEICIEPTLSKKKFKNKNMCVHHFCFDCISKYIEVKLEDHTATNIECPGVDCKHPLDPLACRDVIPKALFDKWCDLLCELAVLKVESCYCPNRRCSVLVLNECGGAMKKSKCPNCKRNFCFQCKIPWHAGYRCHENGQLRDRNDILFGELLERRKWSRCYKCGQSVEKLDGCKEIRCRCGARFCYQCGEPYHHGSCEPNESSEYLFFVLYLSIILMMLIIHFFLMWIFHD